MPSATAKKKSPAKFASSKDVQALTEIVATLAASVKAIMPVTPSAAPAEVIQSTPAPAAPIVASVPPKVTEKDIVKAVPDKYTTNPEWEDIAQEILGDALDHTEIKYLVGGGVLFTIMVKKESSNAPKDYLERYKVDRRSREVGALGESGVRAWCESVKRNLQRPS